MADQRQEDQTYKGLVLSSNGGELPPGSSPTFHNVDIAADGSVIRRPGSNLVITTEVGNSGGAWSQVVKTKRGTEYMVTVTQSRITITLCIEVGGTAFSQVTLVKSNVWKRTLTDVSFVTLAAPFDRLLILTSNHPPVQLSFLERAIPFTCTNATTQAITAPSVASDSKMWRDTNINGNFVQDSATGQYFTVASKGANFNATVPGLGMALNEVRNLVMTNISWQWWAESLLWRGKDIVQGTTRYSVAAIDQNVKIPLDIISDLNPRYNNTAVYRSIFLTNNTNWMVNGSVANPVVAPSTSGNWSHGSGQRYVPGPGIEPQHTPFFATFGALEVTGTQTPIIFHRVRELRFNAGTGVLPANLDIYMDGVLKTSRFNYSATHNLGDGVLYTHTFTATEEIATVTPASTKATSVALFADGRTPSFQAEFVLTNRENKWMSFSGKSLYFLDLPVGGGELDGTYVPAYGLGQFADYENGSFPAFGAIFRDRLVLKTPNESLDQILLSATSDTLSPGNFYTFFQITDALAGIIDDPFTVNITAKSREKITCLLGWQQSLFVFTSVSTYSITGGELFGPESYTTGLVASYGAFNSRCVLATNLTVIFLNRYGLFDLLNKNNTSDYGSFERSEAIRPLFANTTVGSEKDALPWISLNDATNKVYVGLPAPLDTVFCTRVYSLNLAWNSWSTISSSAPFNTYVALQLLTWTMFIVRVQTDNSVVLLQMDAKHNLDFVVNRAGAGMTSVSYPRQIYTTTSDINGIVNSVTPSTAGIFEYSGLVSLGGTYVTTPSQTLSIIPRNWMFDFPDLLPFLGPGPETFASPFVMHATGEPLPLYPRILLVNPPGSISFAPPVSASGATYTTSQVLGTIYPSIFSTSRFFAQSMGKLKRLKKLHLLFDNTYASLTQYFNYPFKQINSAIVIVSNMYPDGQLVTDVELVSDYVRFDSARYDLPSNVLARKAINIPLNGFSCDYQLTVVSTGGDAFKLVGYEFDVEVQRTRSAVRD